MLRHENYGIDKIEVRDNGSGIPSIDVPYVAKRFHTSKISAFSDLEHLSTYGFRGEALGSLCSVSKLSITTRTSNDDISLTYIFNKEGQLIKQYYVSRFPSETSRYPVFCVSIVLPSTQLDVNVDPNKTTVFLHHKDTVLELISNELEKIYGPKDKPSTSSTSQKEDIIEDITKDLSSALNKGGISHLSKQNGYLEDSERSGSTLTSNRDSFSEIFSSWGSDEEIKGVQNNGHDLEAESTAKFVEKENDITDKENQVAPSVGELWSKGHKILGAASDSIQPVTLLNAGKRPLSSPVESQPLKKRHLSSEFDQPKIFDLISNKPVKRDESGFVKFSKEFRPKVIDENPDADYRRNNVGGPGLWKILKTIATKEQTCSTYSFITDQRLIGNGINIKYHIGRESEDLQAEVTGLCNIIPTYGLSDLVEILELIANTNADTLSKSRPLKVINYLQGEAVRMARQLPRQQTADEIEDLMEQILTELPSECCTCLHNKPFFHKLYDINDIPLTQTQE
ncbi:hypothetical protein KUTeg_008766 [Tegillarca granosa]|uniref:DNA mismatch repair protein S5 domain-containing protein n=1 Tax=Tegillarca granosa TaxID=220873 RepID=A0ABQ9FEW5_TEGGR|nr:hypothetical protein KUTeg_008766 [Tegillarca granosa]